MADIVLETCAQNEFGFEHGAAKLRSRHFARQARAVAKRMFELLRTGFQDSATTGELSRGTIPSRVAGRA